jgi:chromosome segregation ATPase
MNRKEQIDADSLELKENIQRLRDEIESIDEKLLRARIKTRECDLERERLEAEIKKNTKHGKQPKGKNV